MKLKAFVVTLVFAAGVATSVAVAKGPPPWAGPPAGKGPSAGASTATGTGTTTGTGKGAAKRPKTIWVCHRTGSGRSVKLRINEKAWKAHERHGDVKLGDHEDSSTTAGTTTGRSNGAGSCAGTGPPGSTTGTTTSP